MNGKRLLSDARLVSDPWDGFLSDDENFPWKPTSLALAILAEEEFAKGFLLFLVGKRIIPWTGGVKRAARDHSCKHLLSALMEYANPDLDQMNASLKRIQAMMKLYDEMDPLYAALTKLHEETMHLDFARYVQEVKAIRERLNALWSEIERFKQKEEEEEGFSPLVADAINILRHTKVGRWEGGYAYDEEVDPSARAIAEGSRDREKQCALYIGVGKDGTVCSRPEGIQKDKIARAFDRSKKLGTFLENLLERGGGGIQFNLLIENLKVMFASEEELRALFPDEMKPSR
jgi:hypothetical protein